MSRIFNLRSDIINNERTEKLVVGLCAHYGSLETIAEAVASGMIGSLEKHSRLGELASTLWGGVGDSYSPATLEFAFWDVTIVTPTSRTRITIRRKRSGWYEVEVEFPGGSECRAEAALAAFKAASIPFFASGEKFQLPIK